MARSAGLAGTEETDARSAAEEELRLKAVRLQDLEATARQQALALIAMMRQAEPTAFALEAGAVYVLRAQRCLSGWQWRAAQFEARAIVRIALTHVGAVRPSWQDGQPVLVRAVGVCSNCGEPLPDDRLFYCSRDCQQAEWTRVNVGYKRQDADRRAACVGKTCRVCSSDIGDRRSNARYCSTECRNRAFDEAQPVRTCLWCRKPFRRYQARRTTGAPRFCCHSCQMSWRHAQRGEGPRPVKAASAEARDV